MKAVTSTIWLIEWTHWGNIRLILGLDWNNENKMETTGIIGVV